MTWLVGWLVIGTSGCHARLQLSAAQSLEALSGALQTAVREYHSEIRTSDAFRRRLVINDFVTRIRTVGEDEAMESRHVAEFHAALDRLSEDETIENGRYIATLENLRVVREIANGLTRTALAWMTLDEAVQQEARQHGLDAASRYDTPVTDER